MKCYLVWYKLEGIHNDFVRGVARNYERAEQMAESLYLHLTASGKNVEAVGVKSGIHGELYLDEELHMRWSVIPPEENDNE